LGQQNWNIIHAFCRDVQLFCHADSLAHFQKVVTICPNHEFYLSALQNCIVFIDFARMSPSESGEPVNPNMKLAREYNYSGGS